MIRGLLLPVLALLLTATRTREIAPLLLLPIETTVNTRTEYSLAFTPDTSVPHSAFITIVFPYEFDPTGLIGYSGCKLKRGAGNL